MKINLLIKIQVGVGPLAFAWKPRVINSSAVRIPGRAAAGGWILHMRDRVGHGFSCRGFINVERPILAPTLRN